MGVLYEVAPGKDGMTIGRLLHLGAGEKDDSGSPLVDPRTGLLVGVHIAEENGVGRGATAIALTDLFELLRKQAPLQARCDALGVANRPHIKTHKLEQVVRMQLKAGITKFKCATFAEAEMAAIAACPTNRSICLAGNADSLVTVEEHDNPFPWEEDALSPQSTADETGLTALIARLGAGNEPTGANVEVGQVEGNDGTGWAPDTSTPGR